MVEKKPQQKHFLSFYINPIDSKATENALHTIIPRIIESPLTHLSLNRGPEIENFNIKIKGEKHFRNIVAYNNARQIPTINIKNTYKVGDLKQDNLMNTASIPIMILNHLHTHLIEAYHMLYDFRSKSILIHKLLYLIPVLMGCKARKSDFIFLILSCRQKVLKPRQIYLKPTKRDEIYHFPHFVGEKSVIFSQIYKIIYYLVLLTIIYRFFEIFKRICERWRALNR